MFSTIKYNNLIPEVDSAFPEFPAYLSDTRRAIEDLKGVYLTFLSVYVIEHWQDITLQVKLAAFINAMEASNDTELKLVYNDFLLDFYLACKEHSISLTIFLNQLSQTAKERMLYNYNHWKEANSKATDGSR